MRTLFLDFDGTICHDKFWRGLPEMERTLVQEFLFLNHPGLVNEWMRGKHSAEEIHQYLSEQMGLDYQYLWDIFVSDCKSMKIEDGVLEIVDRLRSDFHIVLITGNMDSFDRFTVPALKLDTYFPIIANSFNEGILKSEHGGATFKKYLSCDISEAVLIEDSPRSCVVFEEMGGTALRVTSDAPALFHLKALDSKKF